MQAAATDWLSAFKLDFANGPEPPSAKSTEAALQIPEPAIHASRSIFEV
jgi:hypothetical protein